MKHPPRTFTRWFFHFCGSLKLAMLLLAVLIVAIIIGTIVESRFDASVAQTYIYDAPWFLAWLAVLCVNLVGAVLVRYPWKPHQAGFIITHAGIIVILIGAIIGRVWGIEGSMTLFKGQEPSKYLLTGQQVLRGKSAAMTESKSRLLNLDRNPPSSEHPQTLKLKDVKVAAIGFASELGIRMKIEKDAAGGRPALRFVMTSAMVGGKPIDQWLLFDDEVHGRFEFGPAVIRCKSEPRSNAKKEESQNASAELVPSREMHFAFAKMPSMDVARPLFGGPSEIKSAFQFAADGTNSKGELTLQAGEKSFTFSVSENLGREIPLEGTPWTLKLVEYFADFRMQNKEAVSVSDQPNNPAILFEMLGPLVAATESSTEDVHQHAAASASPGMAEFVILRSADGQLKYTAQSRSKKSSSGEIKIGEEFAVGLADWKCRVEEVTEHAVVHEEFGQFSAEAPQRTGASGLLVRLEKGAQTETHWIRMGETTDLAIGGEKVELAFENKLHTLGFTVELEKFEVEMNEGTRNPSSFKSHVRFHDPKTETTLTRAVWMNNPANFPDFAGAGFLGTAYKFSQASWNPNNLDETTLQVIRDPGWSFKWIGSLMLCGGLFTMFYLKPYPRFAKARSAVVKTQIVPEPAFAQTRETGDVLMAK
jgi:hypothetical protein